MALLDGKRILVTGIASNRSIAWGVARAMRREGAELAFTFQNERLGGRVKKLAAELDSSIAIGCDVGEDAEIERLFGRLGDTWPGLDALVHAIAFAPREALDGAFLSGLDREAFRIAHDVSAYSFAALVRGARELMRAGGRIDVDPYLSRLAAGLSELQRDGAGEGEPRSHGALPRAGSRAGRRFG